MKFAVGEPTSVLIQEHTHDRLEREVGRAGMRILVRELLFGYVEIGNNAGDMVVNRTERFSLLDQGVHRVFGFRRRHTR